MLQRLQLEQALPCLQQHGALSSIGLIVRGKIKEEENQTTRHHDKLTPPE